MDEFERRDAETAMSLQAELYEAERKAWDALGRYKFAMFGYWAGVWVHLNRVSGENRPNPWRELVLRARARMTCPSVERGGPP